MRKIEIFMSVAVILATIIGVIAAGEEYLQLQASQPEAEVIVIDPGHGGKDPGKIGCHNEIEKDINLSISLMVGELLEERGYKVVYTRTKDTTATGESNSTKGEDLNARIKIIDEADPLCCVSIHQNSYTSSEARGAQTFFYSGSESGKELASVLQEQLIALADPENTRTMKANDSYYILCNTKCPTVIVECGFLSNQDESLKLNSQEYQKQLAVAIVEGILKYVQKEQH